MVIYVLGGGISGLNTARELAKHGQKVVLIEQAAQLGGLAGYTSFFGRNLDLGPHIFHTPDDEIRDYILHELPGCFHERKHWAANYKNSKYFDYPISKEFIESLPKSVADKIYSELENSDIQKKIQANNYHDYIQALAGPTLQELFFTKYPQKLWGVSTHKLDANWAPKRIQIREKREPFFGDQWSAVGVDGTSTIINELGKQCEKYGVDIKLNTQIQKLKCNSSNEIINIETNNGDISVSPQDIVVNTLPLDIALKLLNHKCELDYRGVILCFVHTTNTNPFPSGIDFIYVDDLEISFNRVSDQNTFVKDVNESDTVLCCEITYSEGDAYDRLEPQLLADRVKAELMYLNILDEKDILDAQILKLPRVYPMFKIGYRDALNRSLSKLGGISNMQTLGSLAEFAYSDLQILFAKSRDLAERIYERTPRINKLGHHKLKFKFNAQFNFYGCEIGNDNPSFLIAEIGLNHNGNLSLAKKLVDSAHQAGFNAVKFQTYQSEGRSSKKGKTSAYVEKVIGTEETDHEMFKKYELDYAQHQELFNYCNSLGIAVFSAPFDEKSVDLLEDLNVDAFKIASMELTNLPLIRYTARKGKPIILSTGMATLAEIEEALDVIAETENANVAILQCTSIYPAPADAINLRAISTLKSAFKVPVGFSDHFSSNTMSIGAITLGAHLIEKHITLDRKMEGPDHALSLEPLEQQEFVKTVRDIEAGLGNGLKRPHRDEAKSELRFRKSLYFKRDLPKNTIISLDDIVLKAPCFGILPKFQEIVVGMRLNQAVKANDPITWSVIS